MPISACSGGRNRIWYAMNATKVPTVIDPFMTRRPPYTNTAPVPAERTRPGSPPDKYERSCIDISAAMNAAFRSRKRPTSRSCAFDVTTSFTDWSVSMRKLPMSALRWRSFPISTSSRVR